MQKIEEDMKAATRRLWELCFEDSSDFMDLYFAMRYKDDLNVALKKNDEWVSALQIIPYEMTLGSRLLDVAYLSGVCTHPDFRKQGLMRALLERTHRRLFDDGYVLSTLIPAESWLFGCYAVSGYVPLFDYTYTVERPSSVADGLIISDYRQNNEGVFAYFDRKMKERLFCIQHSKEDFDVILADLYLSKGHLWVARRGTEVVGLALGTPETVSCCIKELLADDVEVQKSLITWACSVCRSETVEWIRPVQNSSKAHSLGMLRIICVQKVLDVYAASHPEQTCCFLLTDKEILENNGCFELKDGECVRLTESCIDAEEMDVVQLAEYLWGEEHPYMSLMLN